MCCADVYLLQLKTAFSGSCFVMVILLMTGQEQKKAVVEIMADS